MNGALSLLTSESRTQTARSPSLPAPDRRLFRVLNDRQRRAAHLRLQLGDQGMQQLMPVLVARQDVNIQRRLALFVGFFDARSQIHLQRMVVQHHFLRMGDQRGKTQKIAQRVVLCQLAQTLCAAVVEVLESGNNNGGIYSAVRFSLDPSSSCGIMRILIQMTFPVSGGLHGTSAGDVSLPTFWLPILPPSR